MDNVRIYNYARTPAQIAYDYNRGAPVAHYKMDECTGGTVTANAWNHIVVTTGTAISSANAIKLGLVGSTYYSGQLDDVRIYNYALSVSQVKLLYNQGGAVRFAPTSGNP